MIRNVCSNGALLVTIGNGVILLYSNDGNESFRFVDEIDRFVFDFESFPFDKDLSTIETERSGVKTSVLSMRRHFRSFHLPLFLRPSQRFKVEKPVLFMLDEEFLAPLSLNCIDDI